MNHVYDLVEFKATPGDGPRGLFAAKVSVFGNVDRNGDKVMPGAFAKSLERLRKAGKPIPVIWSHEHKDPTSYIGTVYPSDIHETSDSLTVAGKMDVETNPRAAQVYDLLNKGLVTQWSFAYQVIDERIGEDLSRELMEVDGPFEVGPTLIGANAETRTLALKELAMEDWRDGVAMLGEEVETETKAVDNSAWDGNRAMGMCSTASEYRSICAGEHSTPDDTSLRAHWALPHHFLGRGPNADGVRNALSRLPQTQNLSNRDAAERHLQAHMSQINPEASAVPELKGDPEMTAAFATFDSQIDELLEAKIGRVLSAKMEAKIRSALQTLQDALSALDKDEAPTEQASSTSEATEQPKPPSESELMRRETERVGLFLAERGR